MARIRNVKPDFFRHRRLQELEKNNPGKYVMLVFQGLWLQADRCGRFPWNEDQLCLDILPWLDFEIGESMRLLAEHDFIVSYEVGGKHYGLLPNFEKDQSFCKEEREKSPRYPAPPPDILEKYPDSSDEEMVLGKRGGRGAAPMRPRSAPIGPPLRTSSAPCVPHLSSEDLKSEELKRGNKASQAKAASDSTSEAMVNASISAEKRVALRLFKLLDEPEEKNNPTTLDEWMKKSAELLKRYDEKTLTDAMKWALKDDPKLFWTARVFDMNTFAKAADTIIGQWRGIQKKQRAENPASTSKKVVGEELEKLVEQAFAKLPVCSKCNGTQKVPNKFLGESPCINCRDEKARLYLSLSYQEAPLAI
jgi:hypothetical protein